MYMKKDFIKKSLLAVILLVMTCGVHAQYMTEMFVTDCPDGVQKENVQQNITKLLTQCNVANADMLELDLTNISISEFAQKKLTELWKNTPFRCGDTEVIQACLKTADGNYQVRNIPIYLKNADGEEEYQEAVIGFNAKGDIVDFNLALANNLYIKVLKKGYDVTDLRYRQMILDYVEQFRTAYNTKDIPFLQQIYSDDALIITGKVIKSAPSDINNFAPSEKIIYSRQNKKEYLSNLARIFRNNKRIHVIFDDIKVMRHPSKEKFYGVTLKQGYSSDNYSDVGYLFLLWDFTNSETPQIHVRTWQPEMINTNTKLPEEEIFTCEDFDIK